MGTLEDKIRPPFIANPRRRDILGIVLLVALAASLLPTVLFYATSASDPASQGQLRLIPSDQVVPAIIDPMVSVYLLAAMGFLLALRFGALDLSVWALGGVSGVIAATLINAGVAPLFAMVLAVLTGVIVGVVNALLIVLVRLPSAAVTIATGLVIMFSCQLQTTGREVRVVDDAFDAWHLTARVHSIDENSRHQKPIAETPPSDANDPVVTEVASLGLPITRMLIVVGIYSIVMFVLVEGGILARRGVQLTPRRAMFLSLVASGALSAAAGALWVLEYGSAPVLTRPIGDLRIPAAAILAGGAYFGGRGRTLLAGLCLPLAMLLTVIWRQGVWNYQIEGYAVQVLVLAIMAFVVYAAFSQALAGRRIRKPLAIPAATCCMCSLVVLAGAAKVGDGKIKNRMYAVAFVTWTIGLALLLLSRHLAQRAKRQLT